MFNEIVQICDLTKCKGSLKSKPKQNSSQRKVGLFSNYYITNYFCGVRLISLWMIFHVHAACVTGWITALVSLSVRLMSGSCQTSFLLCTIFLFGSNARLITACFLLCQVLVRLFTALSSLALVQLMLGPRLVQMSGCV